MELTAKLSDNDIHKIADVLMDRLSNLLRPLSQNISELREETPAIGKHIPEHLRKDYLTTDDIKQMYGIGFFGLRAFRNEGKLNPARFGKRIFYKREEIDAILRGDVQLDAKGQS